MPKCPACSAEYSSGQLFCSECGARLPQDAVSENAPTPVYEPEPAPEQNTTAQYTSAPAEQPARFSSDAYAPQPEPAYDAPRPQYEPQPAAVPVGGQTYAQQSAAQQPAQQYAQPQYTAQQPVQPVYSAPKREDAPAKDSPYAPVSTGAFYGAMLLLAVPVVGLIVAIVWACGGCRRKNLRHFALAHILYGLTAVLLGIISCALIWSCCRNEIVTALGDMGYELVDGNGEVITADDSSVGQNAGVAQLSGNGMEQLRQLTSGDYLIRYKIDIMGMTVDGLEAVSGSKLVSKMEFSGLFSSCMLYDGSAAYKYDDDRKVYCTTDEEPERVFDMSWFSAEAVDSGTDTFNGRELQYEVYATDYDERIYLFLDNDGTPCGIRSISDDETLDMIFTELSDSPDASMFSIPSDYEQVSEDEILGESWDY